MSEENIQSYFERFKLIKQGLLPREAVAKEKKPLRKESPKTAAAKAKEREERGDSGLDKYFEHHMKHAAPICMNCGLEARWLLEERYSFLWRSCQAHVLAKKDGIGGFPSVAANLLNHLVLFPHFAGLCNCHGKFDSSYENMAKMDIFPKAIDIINRLYPLIAKEERKYLPEIITQEIKPKLYNK
jgi:hypothetical protein